MDPRENTYMIPRIWIGSCIPDSPKAGQMPLDFQTVVYAKAEVKQQSASHMVLTAHTAAEEHVANTTWCYF